MKKKYKKDLKRRERDLKRLYPLGSLVVWRESMAPGLIVGHHIENGYFRWERRVSILLEGKVFLLYSQAVKIKQKPHVKLR